MNMAISGIGSACKPHFSLGPPLFFCSRKVRFGAIAAAEMLRERGSVKKENSDSEDSGHGRASDNSGKELEWRKLNSKQLGVSTSKINRPTRKVLNELKKKGYKVYLVGGCVRDLILKQIPKDFDIITSAELKEVVRTFSRCEIIGRRFPICHVHIDDSIVEVSSFSISPRIYGRESNFVTRKPTGVEEEDYIRWRNCLQRDFTINGFMFDPYGKIIYDYLGGIEDIRKAKVRTIIPADTSFQEDCARILRAVRIAARLGFRFARKTAQSIKALSCSVLRLDKGRLMMEMNYMLGYGSGETSLRLLWKFGLLDILLPIQAAYFVHQGFRRRDKRSNMLLCLFFNLDKLVAPDRPCHGSLWIAILAFHKALFDQPRDPLVIAAFALAIHNGGDTTEAVNIAQRISRPHETSFSEILEPQHFNSKTLMKEIKDLAASVKASLSKMTDEQFVSQALAEYPQAPYSDLVFIPLGLYLKVCRIFECVDRGRDNRFVAKQGSEINYELLAVGSLAEVRHTFARIVFDTVYPLNLERDNA